IPDRQKEKLALIQSAAKELEPSLGPAEGAEPLTDPETIAALNTAAQSLARAAGDRQGAGAAAARRLAGDLVALAPSHQTPRTAVEAAFIPPLRTAGGRLRQLPHPPARTPATTPPPLKRP